MSLIDEALKRARQEAARQDAEARELRYRQVPVIPGLRQRPRRSWLLPALLAACLAAGVGIGLGLSRSGGGGEDVQVAAVPPAPPAPAAAPAPAVQETQAVPAPLPPVVEESAPPVVEEESPAPAAPAPAPEPEPEEEPRITDMRSREISLTPAAPRPQPEERPVAPEPPIPAPAPVEPAPAPVAAPGEVRTYQQEMPLASGGTLRLNGIAFSEQPVALFGDKVVAPGESVAGYKVVAIEARRVRLEGPGGTVVVELP
jgi:hypothetical protein